MKIKGTYMFYIPIIIIKSHPPGFAWILIPWDFKENKLSSSSQ